jgi:hypothetical protein
MLLVPATVVHPGEVLVPEPGRAATWRTAAHARSLALSRAASDDAAVEAAADALRLRGIPRPLEGGLAGFFSDESSSSSSGSSGSAAEIDVDGEKLTYIQELETGPPVARRAASTAAGVAAPRRSAEEEVAWKAFDARMAALESAEAASGAAGVKAAAAAAPPAAAPAPAPRKVVAAAPAPVSAPVVAAAEPPPAARPPRPLERVDMGPVKESDAQAPVGLHTAPPAEGSSRPVSRFKSGRPAREAQF